MVREQFKGKLLRVYCSESDEWKGERIYEVVIAKAREAGILCATVYRGVEGFGQSAELHKSGIWPFGKDAPVMVSLIDREEIIDSFLPELEKLICEGLVATSAVEVLRYGVEDRLP